MKVREQLSLSPTTLLDVSALLAELPLQLGDDDAAQLAQACEMLQQVSDNKGVDCGDWAAESDCLAAGVDTLHILAELQVGLSCLIAGLLYRALREQRLQLAQVEKRFGSEVASLLRGVLRMAATSDLKTHRDQPVLGQAEGQQENIRKMLVSLVDDVRVALIRLAERTCAIRAVKDDEQRREQVAREVFDVYAPLAHRLGIGHLKWELEDLSFRYIYPDAYRKIAGLLDGKRLERDRFIATVREDLNRVLTGAGLQVDIKGRAKHIFSIWRKMQRKGIGFSQVYDIRAVRILVPEIKDCYATLGLVHGLWRNIPNEFDDYIANPKENGYRSLHTAVIGPLGKILEVQIRTEDMNEEAELGVCAHWRYKGSDAADAAASSYEEKIAWLRQVLDWHEETGEAGGVVGQFGFDTSQDRVYVFTPQGDVVNLAQGATPLDFAYHVHTEVGHTCRGAKVNGTIVPLTYELKTGERVEILTSRQGVPRRDWLQSDLGYLRTSRARAKVHHWFRTQDRDENINSGRSLLEREFKRLALTSIDYKLITRKLQLAKVDDMYAAVGSGELSSAQVLAVAQQLLEKHLPKEPQLQLTPQRRESAAGTIEVLGVGNLMTSLAGCCRPVPGDRITGFITQGRGVSVHRADCKRMLDLAVASADRVIDVEWGEAGGNDYLVDLAIEAYDRQGLISDVSTLFTNARVNVVTLNTETNKKRHTATMRVRVEVSDLNALSRLLERINRLNNVISAYRLSDEDQHNDG